MDPEPAEVMSLSISVANLSGHVTRHLSGQGTLAPGEAIHSSSSDSPLVAAPSSSHSSLHAGSGSHGLCLRSNSLGSVPYQDSSASHSNQVRPFPSLPRSAHTSLCPDPPCPQVVVDVPDADFRTLFPFSPLDGADNGRKPPGLGESVGNLSVQGVWSSEEHSLPINILQLRAIHLSLLHCTDHLRGHLVRVQSDKSTAVAYLNHQGAMAETALILSWAVSHVQALSAVHIPDINNWIADFLNREHLDSGEWALHPQVFLAICASRFNHKV
ncbi:uncharacterized protein LOC121000608 [Bufo bufo]|uniref:uncharacterized protein LOC121000608 n=1 Tax=Bufo bufo TaxID=8384 RepID=UPI001ABE8965|nr:uncharacterized protein LOC121000608 [Bufo bufo]